MPESDEELLKRIQGGCKSAFDELASRFAPSLWRHINRIVRDPDVTEDVLQEVFIRLWQKASSWDGSGSARGWVMKIATNLSFNYRRSIRRRAELPLVVSNVPEDDEDEDSQLPWQLESSLPGPAAEYDVAQKRSFVHALIGELPETKREVMHLVHCEDLSVGEVAGELGIPRGTVKSRLFYGRKAIEDRLKSYIED